MPVISKKTKDIHGYNALQIGFGSKKAKNISKAERGHFAKIHVEPKEKIAEFKVSEDALIDVGKIIGVNHFVIGQKVDVIGSSKGKGFAGAMKRHNFAGLRASHGVLFHIELMVLLVNAKILVKFLKDKKWLVNLAIRE